MCCTAACTKFSVGGRYICSSRRTSSLLFVHKVINIFFCTVWSSLICTPAATHTEINHSGLSLNQYEWPAVGLWPSSTRFSHYRKLRCQNRCICSPTCIKYKLKHSVGFVTSLVDRLPSFSTRRCKARMAGGSVQWYRYIGEFPSLVLETATRYRIFFRFAGT